MIILSSGTRALLEVISVREINWISLFSSRFSGWSMTALGFKWRKARSLSEWCFIISIGVSGDHPQLRYTGFAGSY